MYFRYARVWGIFHLSTFPRFYPLASLPVCRCGFLAPDKKVATRELNPQTSTGSSWRSEQPSSGHCGPKMDTIMGHLRPLMCSQWQSLVRRAGWPMISGGSGATRSLGRPKVGRLSAGDEPSHLFDLAEHWSNFECGHCVRPIGLVFHPKRGP